VEYLVNFKATIDNSFTVIADNEEEAIHLALDDLKAELHDELEIMIEGDGVEDETESRSKSMV